MMMEDEKEEKIDTVKPFLKSSQTGKCCGCFQIERGCLIILVLNALSAIGGFIACTIPDLMLGIPKIAALIFGIFALKMKDALYAKAATICYFICVPIYAWCFVYFFWIGKSIEPWQLGGKALETYNIVLGVSSFFGMFLQTYWAFVWMNLSYKFAEQKEETKQEEEEIEELEISSVHESLHCGKEKEQEKNVREIQNETLTGAAGHVIIEEIPITLSREHKIVPQKRSERESKHIRFADPVKTVIIEEGKRRQIYNELKRLEDRNLRTGGGERRITTNEELGMNAIFIEESTQSVESQHAFSSGNDYL